MAELRAAVEAAENWGTYVTVHAYTPRAVRQAIEAGVKCIDHGNLLDDDTAKLMADKGVWWSLQPFLDDRPSAFAEGTSNRAKQLTMYGGTDAAYAAAKKHKIKTAWGTDNLFSAEEAARQWLPAGQDDTLVHTGRSAAHGDLGQCRVAGAVGPAQPLPRQAGRGAGGRAADLLLVDGDPLANLNLVARRGEELRGDHEGRQGLQEHRQALNRAGGLRRHPAPGSGRAVARPAWSSVMRAVITAAR